MKIHKYKWQRIKGERLCRREVLLMLPDVQGWKNSIKTKHLLLKIKASKLQTMSVKAFYFAV